MDLLGEDSAVLSQDITFKLTDASDGLGHETVHNSQGNTVHHVTKEELIESTRSDSLTIDQIISFVNNYKYIADEAYYCLFPRQKEIELNSHLDEVIKSVIDGECVNSMRALLEYGVNKDHRLNIGTLEGRYNTPSLLSYACRLNKADLVNLLLERDADANAENINGYSALDHAFINENVIIMEVLLKHGANVNQERCAEQSFLNATIRKNTYCLNPNIEILELLLKYGANVSDTLLIEVASSVNPTYRLEAIKLLLKQENVRADVINSRGYSALISVTKQNDNEAVEILLQYGAKTEVRDICGQTPLQIAATECNPEICKKLLDHNASIVNIDHTLRSIKWHEGGAETLQVLLNYGASMLDHTPSLYHQTHWKLSEHKAKLENLAKFLNQKYLKVGECANQTEEYTLEETQYFLKQCAKYNENDIKEFLKAHLYSQNAIKDNVIFNAEWAYDKAIEDYKKKRLA